MIKKKRSHRSGKWLVPRWNWIWKIPMILMGISIFWVLALKFINPPITYLMVQRGFERTQKGLDWKIEKKWTAYENLNKHLIRAAIASEDARFTDHWGFDTQAIQEAYQKNKESKTIRGGSTISQQTAKNVFLWPKRSYFRKAVEAYFTVLIELIWGKERIMEVYLNIIETGDGIYGVEAAALQNFNASQSKLNKRQSALIVAVLPNPRRWTPGKPTVYIQKRASNIMRYMNHYQIP